MSKRKQSTGELIRRVRRDEQLMLVFEGRRYRPTGTLAVSCLVAIRMLEHGERMERILKGGC